MEKFENRGGKAAAAPTRVPQVGAGVGGFTSSIGSASSVMGSNFTSSITSRMAAAGVSARAAAGANQFSLQGFKFGTGNFMGNKSTSETFDKAKTVFGKAKFGNF
eukprot:scaffold666594_cov34-Prasinocladus_malaysianus.AAC.1